MNLLFLDKIKVDGHCSFRSLWVLLLVLPVQQHLLIVDYADSLLLREVFALLLLHHFDP